MKLVKVTVANHLGERDIWLNPDKVVWVEKTEGRCSHIVLSDTGINVVGKPEELAELFSK